MNGQSTAALQSEELALLGEDLNAIEWRAFQQQFRNLVEDLK
eukprot:gene8462-7460_t